MLICLYLSLFLCVCVRGDIPRSLITLRCVCDYYENDHKMLLATDHAMLYAI